MLFDAENMFSENQAITASGVSENILDLGAPGTVPYGSALVRSLGDGEPVPIVVQVTEGFNNLTDLSISVEVDDNSGFASAKTVATSGAIALADLLAGYKFNPRFIPRGVNERYMRLQYTVGGAAPTTGKITAGIAAGDQTNS